MQPRPNGTWVFRRTSLPVTGSLFVRGPPPLPVRHLSRRNGGAFAGSSAPRRKAAAARRASGTSSASRRERAGFRGFGRYGVEQGDGTFEFVTVKPGPVPGPAAATQAPHVDVSVFARGMLNRCVTRIYFGDETQANAADPVLMRVPADRRDTLIAQGIDGGYALDIRIQGDGETVFFAI